MRFLAGAPALLLLACWLVLGQSILPPSPSPPAQAKEKLTYAVEWRLIRAGTVTVERQPHQSSMRLESAGIVSTLFRIDDVYTVHYEDAACATSSVMESMERERHHETRVTYDRSRNHASFIERDLVTNMVMKETGTTSDGKTVRVIRFDCSTSDPAERVTVSWNSIQGRKPQNRYMG